MKIKTSEIFSSIQGEIQGIGLQCMFIRLFGCNLGPKCPIDCDTKYSWSEENNKNAFKIFDVDEIMEMIREKKPLNIVITGGEPLLQKYALEKLVEKIRKVFPQQIKIFIETNGTIEPPKKMKLDVNIYFNVSPKSEHFTHSIFPLERSVFKHVVIPSKENMKKLLEYIQKLDQKIIKKSFFMPHAKNRKEYLVNAKKVAEWCIKNNLNFGPRLHLLLWDGKKGF
ncbi:MAG: 7-carboxy-7-deazaguanine synthase QueE [Promethearchaeota archaeon]